MQSYIWNSTIPICIRHESSPTPYLILVPRLSYFPLLLPRLILFFGSTESENNAALTLTSFSYEGILLKNLPVGLLYDLYQPSLPWPLSLGDGPLYEMHDTFINSVKEADFIRNGTAKGVISMSKEDSTQLWNSTLLNPPTLLKHVPLRLYVPSTPDTTTGLSSFTTVQTLVTPLTASQEVRSLGSALNLMLPSLFPNSRNAANAKPILHGAPIPFHTPLEELMREAAFADGWLHICIRILHV
ncbi:Autophagy protein 5 [Golovinomyces cichoracearum]|uniref:Autophagy protein 5 n=1 Tax=Golovinomyces cichoracearum TaxID=62708 RepID=A0A420H7M6_9PEZI|nr:Autophagy protein 5 [Golovinomyces cichoracearum]